MDSALNLCTDLAYEAHRGYTSVEDYTSINIVIMQVYCD